MKGTAKAPARADINADFPLRGFVNCHDCGKPLTACWSKGKTKTYPYYLCPTKGCASYRKSIRREDIEGQFEALLKQMQPTEGLFKLVEAMFRDAWEMRLAQAKDVAKSFQKQISAAEKQIEQLISRIMEAESKAVISAYEKKIAKLEREKLVAAEKLENSGESRYNLRGIVRTLAQIPLKSLENMAFRPIGAAKNSAQIGVFGANCLLPRGRTSNTKNVHTFQYVRSILLWKMRYGAPGKIRTPDPQIRSLVLYPAELPVPVQRDQVSRVQRS